MEMKLKELFKFKYLIICAFLIFINCKFYDNNKRITKSNFDKTLNVFIYDMKKFQIEHHDNIILSISVKNSDTIFNFENRPLQKHESFDKLYTYKNYKLYLKCSEVLINEYIFLFDNFSELDNFIVEEELIDPVYSQKYIKKDSVFIFKKVIW